MTTKKILSIVLAIILVFSVTAFALENSKQSSQSTKAVEVHKFENTYYKLKTEKKLNIGYLGGSITAGTAASNNEHTWASLVTEWFKAKFPEAEIVGNNVGIGGTGTVFGQYRIIEDFKLESETEKPDLIFLEFAINDAYDGTSPIAAKNNMNTILKSIYSYAPKADVVILLTTDNGNSEEKSGTQAAHQEIADAYKIPVIDIGGMLLDDMLALPEANGHWINVWSKYFPDNVHPNDMGHLKYASYITYYLDLAFSKKVKAASTLTDAYIPADADKIFGEPLENPHTVNLKGQTAPTGFSINSDGVISTTTAGSFKIEFKGTSLSLWTNLKPTGCIVDVVIDDKEPVRISLIQSNPYATIKPVMDGLEDTTHTATITVSASSGGSEAVIDRFCLTGSDLDSGVTIVS